MVRFFDIFFSSIAILFFFPLLVPITLVLKVTGEGEFFFLQERVGQGGKIFKLFKFATMLKDSPNIGTGTITIKDDPRVLPFGKFLRKTKINELPQLFNILKGDMSLIGPRPLTINAFNSYPVNTKEIIQKVKPGLSGLGSIIFRNEENLMTGITENILFYDNYIAPYKGSLEIWFVENKSLYLYFKLILITIWVVIFPSSQVLKWNLFKNLPKPPKDLISKL